MIESHTIESPSCRACGQRHHFRLTIARRPANRRNPASVASVTLGFFARCPITSANVWWVVPLEDTGAGRAQLLEVAYAEGGEWGELEAALVPASCPWSPSEPQDIDPRREHWVSGPRDGSRVPDALRRALGCPIFSPR